MDREILLFEEQFDDQPVEAGQSVPVDEPGVVARGVVAVVVELDGSAPPLAPPLPGQFPGEEVPGGDIQPVQLGQEPGREEFVGGSRQDGLGSARG